MFYGFMEKGWLLRRKKSLPWLKNKCNQVWYAAGKGKEGFQKERDTEQWSKTGWKLLTGVSDRVIISTHCERCLMEF